MIERRCSPVVTCRAWERWRGSAANCRFGPKSLIFCDPFVHATSFRPFEATEQGVQVQVERFEASAPMKSSAW